MKMRMAAILAAAALIGTAQGLGSDDPFGDGEGPPRRDRHGKRLKVEPTHHTTSKSKSASLSKLLRK